MAIQIQDADGFTKVYVTGKLTSDDYEQFLPAVEDRICKKGKLRILFNMHDFHGWTAGALWEDFKFDVHHFKDIERLAIVGEKRWQKGMSAFCKPFTTAQIRYFDRSEVEAARTWLRSGAQGRSKFAADHLPGRA